MSYNTQRGALRGLSYSNLRAATKHPEIQGKFSKIVPSTEKTSRRFTIVFFMYPTVINVINQNPKVWSILDLFLALC